MISFCYSYKDMFQTLVFSTVVKVIIHEVINIVLICFNRIFRSE